jgi:hypothetical protein
MENSLPWLTMTSTLSRPTRKKNEWRVSRGRWSSRLLSNGMAMSKKFTLSSHCRLSSTRRPPIWCAGGNSKAAKMNLYAATEIPKPLGKICGSSLFSVHFATLFSSRIKMRNLSTVSHFSGFRTNRSLAPERSVEVIFDLSICAGTSTYCQFCQYLLSGSRLESPPSSPERYMRRRVACFVALAVRIRRQPCNRK